VKIPQVLLIEVTHAPGRLAKVLAHVAEFGLTIQGLEAIKRTQDKTLWELSLNVDEGQEAMVSKRLEETGAAHVLGRSDRVFDRHRGGKIDVRSMVQIGDLKTLRDVYTPGVARVCLAIAKDPAKAREFTAIPRTVAVVTNGTAILGLGDIGPVAGMPVMEGKAALFREFGGISGVPILVESKDVDEIVHVVRTIHATFGAIQLEDFAAPDCFEIESRLRRELPIPVLHDDQHGTAVVVLAALISGARMAGFDLAGATVGQIGLGAAGLGIARLLLRYGVPEVIGTDLAEHALERLERAGGVRATLDEVMSRSEVVIATTGVKDLVRPSMIRAGQSIFALSNPEPEIEPLVALEHGARFAADGKNINNVLAFPGLFRGALDAGATSFTDEMLIAAAEAIAEVAAEHDELIPSPISHEAHDRVARAVAAAAAQPGTPIAYGQRPAGGEGAGTGTR